MLCSLIWRVNFYHLVVTSPFSKECKNEFRTTYWRLLARPVQPSSIWTNCSRKCWLVCSKVVLGKHCVRWVRVCVFVCGMGGSPQWKNAKPKASLWQMGDCACDPVKGVRGCCVCFLVHVLNTCPGSGNVYGFLKQACIQPGPGLAHWTLT